MDEIDKPALESPVSESQTMPNEAGSTDQPMNKSESVASADKPKKRNWVKIALISFIVLFCLSVVLIVLLLIRNGNGDQNATPTPTPSESVTETPSPTETVTPTEGVTNTPTSTPMPAVGTLTGSISYASEGIPPLHICAVNVTTGKETCVDTKLNQGTYNLDVSAGQYRVYTQLTDNLEAVAYSIASDASTNTPEIPDAWNDEGFVCHTDATCKAFFKPAVFKVTVGSKVKANLGNGWNLNTDQEKWSDFF